MRDSMGSDISRTHLPFGGNIYILNPISCRSYFGSAIEPMKALQ
jgi:hypothetical protein